MDELRAIGERERKSYKRFRKADNYEKYTNTKTKVEIIYNQTKSNLLTGILCISI